MTTRRVGYSPVSGLMAMGIVLPDGLDLGVHERHARQMRQLAELAKLTGRAEEDIATEFVGQRMSWDEFYRAKLWEHSQGKR